MNLILFLFLVVGIFGFLLSGNGGALLPLVTRTTADCGTFILNLMFLTAFFSGIIKIGEDAGLIRLISKLLHPLLKRIFQTKSKKTLEKISANISANMLGIGNAATPSGLAAMKELDSENPTPLLPSADMCKFMLFNTCSVQLMPTTILGLRAMAGSNRPDLVVLPVILVSFCSLFLGLTLCSLWYPRWRCKARKEFSCDK